MDDEYLALKQQIYKRLTREQRNLIDFWIYCWGKTGTLPVNGAVDDRAPSTVKTHINDICKRVDPGHRWPNKKIKRLLLIAFFWPVWVQKRKEPLYPPPNVDPVLVNLPLASYERQETCATNIDLQLADESEFEDLAISNLLDCQTDEMDCTLQVNADYVPKERALVLSRPCVVIPLPAQRALLALETVWRGVSRCKERIVDMMEQRQRGHVSIVSPPGRILRYTPRWQIWLMRIIALLLVLLALFGAFTGRLAAAGARPPLFSRAPTLRPAQMLLGHRGIIHMLAWAHHHPWLASDSTDGTVRIWDGSAQWASRQLIAFHQNLSALNWSPDDRSIAVSPADNTIYIVAVATGAIVQRLIGHTNQVQWLAWSPDGKLLATASWDFTVRIWNPMTGTLVRVLTDHTDEATAVAWSPDSQWLATGANDDDIFVYHVPDWDHPRQFIGHVGPVRSLMWSADGGALLSTSVDETARVWDVATGHDTLRMVHDVSLKAGVWGPGPYQGYVATAGENGHLYLWDTRGAQGMLTTPLLVADAAQFERQTGATGDTSDNLGSVAWYGDWLATGSLNLSLIILWRVTPAP
jgi:WD40 repeat protein